MQIWTFWEPKDKIPYYIQLCMKTWTKFLPEANVTVLDFSNIQKYINVNEFGENLLSGRFSLPQIADAIRVMLLEKYGGIWLDVDTIILDRSAKIFFNDDKKSVTFFGNLESQGCHIAFIKAKSDSECLTLWLQFIKESLGNLTPQAAISWDFFGNSFVDDYSKNNPSEVEIIDRNLVMPELEISKTDTSSNASFKAYVEYYFLQQRHIEDVKESMLLLHNSWTPAPFKTINEKDFLRCNCTMSNILMALLNMKRNPKGPMIKFK